MCYNFSNVIYYKKNYYFQEAADIMSFILMEYLMYVAYVLCSVVCNDVNNKKSVCFIMKLSHGTKISQLYLT